MGGFSSKASPSHHDQDDHQQWPPNDEAKKFADRIRSAVEDELARKAMVQREVQIAVNVAKARDTIWVFGSAWTALVAGAVGARAAGRHVPPLLSVPIVAGALVLGNMADMAYGNKMMRIVREAEYILDNERGRFVPFRQVSCNVVVLHVVAFHCAILVRASCDLHKHPNIVTTQAPFHKFYSKEDKASFYDTATAVGELFPNRFIARGPSPPAPKS